MKKHLQKRAKNKAKEDDKKKVEDKRVPLARFSTVIGERNKAREEIQNLKAQLEVLQKPKEEKKDELAELKIQLTELKEMAERDRLARLKLEVATETKLPPKLAERLVGKDRDELLADALTLVEILPEAPVGSLPRGNLTSTPEITVEQMNDPEWVKNNSEQIFKAMRDGSLPV